MLNMLLKRFASEVPGFGFQVPGSGSVDSRPPLRLLLTVTRFQVPVPSPGVEPGQGLNVRRYSSLQTLKAPLRSGLCSSVT